MKIGINAAHLNERPTGIGVFTKEVSRALSGLHEDLDIFTSLPMTGINASQIIKSADILQGSLESSRNLCRAIYINTVLPVKTAMEKIDVLYCPMLEYPYFPLTPLVVSVHDLHPIMYPSQFGLSSLYFRLSLARLARAATRVTTVSEYVKKELLASTDLSEEMVDVIPNGYNKDMFRPCEPEQKSSFLEKYSLGKGFILYVGNLFRYKNVKTLTEAFLKIKDEIDQTLVIAGRLDLSDELLPSDQRIRYMGYLPYEELPGFYSYADLFVHPSLAEGFGFTPLEAMACGAPVLCSDRASLPEVIGDAGILFDPLDITALSMLIVETLRDEELLKDLSQRGLAQAAKFSWEKTARCLMKTFEKAMGASQ